MTPLELLAPARDKTVGIAAIDCGADAVYIAGPGWGNRHAASNSLGDIRELCAYAHSFGVRIYLTVNTLIHDDEWPEVHSMMLAAQEAGVDAFIFREQKLLSLEGITVPMHASTQCSIRTVERARELDALGCDRIILERGLSLREVRQICRAVSCEVEFFVHGALCVCYSGECRLSEYLDGRSADRGECIQACRSMYDLVDSGGKVLVHDKALLSLRDFRLLDRLEDLAGAGVCSFKIEGRLKNESYVRNVVREYSLALDALVSKYPDRYCRSSYGKVSGGFTPDSFRTFNRGYTTWWLDGKRDRWSCMDAPKSMGEYVGDVASVKPSGSGLRVTLRPAHGGVSLSNGDGFAFVEGSAVRGFRADRAEGLTLECKRIGGLRPGVRVFRNLDAAFERSIESNPPRRCVDVALDVAVRGGFVIDIKAETADGRSVVSSFRADVPKADNRERAGDMLRSQLGKRSGVYAFSVRSIDAPGALPLLSASTINSMRRCVAEDIPSGMESPRRERNGAGACHPDQAERNECKQPLMRSRYCIKYELGLCPRYQGARATGPLFLVNNGRSLALGFHCADCEMTVDKIS